MPLMNLATFCAGDRVNTAPEFRRLTATQSKVSLFVTFLTRDIAVLLINAPVNGKWNSQGV